MDGSLLREVARVQHDKTLQLVRDAMDRVPLTAADSRDSWKRNNRSAEGFKKDLLRELQQIREAAQ